MTHLREDGLLDDDIYLELARTLSVGCWVIEKPADGSHPRMYGNRGLHDLLEAPEGLSGEAFYDFWFGRVDPSFRSSLMIAKGELASGRIDRDSAVYAWLHPSKGWIFLRAVAARETDTGDCAHLMGSLKEVETEFQIRMLDDRQFKIQEPRKLQIYAPYFLETSEKIHEIEPETLVVTPISFRQDHYDIEPERVTVGEMTQAHAHPDDRERILAVFGRESVERMIRTGEEVCVQYRAADKLLGWRWVEAKIFAIEVAGRPKLLFKTVDIGERRRIQALEAENHDLIEAMFNIYAAVAEVDLTTGDVRVLKQVRGNDQVLPDSVPVARFAKTIAPRIVLPSERDEYLAYMNIDSLRAAAVTHEHGDCTFRVRSIFEDESYVTVRMSRLYIKDRTDKVYIVYSRENFDPTSNEVAGKMASQSCDCLYYVDLQSGYFRCLFARDSVVAGHEGEGYWKNLCALTERYVVPEDREMVVKMLSSEAISEELRESGEYAFTYGMVYDDRKYRRKEVIVRWADRKHGVAMIQRNDITDAYEAAQRQAMHLAIVEHEASLDGLTQCYNRTAGLKRIEEHLIESIEPSALLLLDLDNFKEINDTFGHKTGDEVLQRFAQTLRRSVRTSDLVVRIGGDEVAVFLRDVGTRENVSKCVKKIFMRIMTETFITDDDFDVGASMGVAVSPADGSTFSELYERADEALYRVKRDGKNGFAFFRR